VARRGGDHIAPIAADVEASRVTERREPAGRVRDALSLPDGEVEVLAAAPGLGGESGGDADRSA
jgi:hypothetical protein